VQKVVIATDDPRIQEAATAWGAEVVMTPADCASGTDRAALVAAEQDAEIVINVQGDEPLVTGASLDRLAEAFEDPSVEAATLREPFESAGDLFDTNQVKVVTTPAGDALYFSRSPIPYLRGKGHLTFDFRAALFARPAAFEGYWKHVGIYAYRRSVLLQFARTAPTPLELSEGLEQLRLLETGRKIRVFDAGFRSIGVDTPQDLRTAAQLLDERETKR
jgi:3-deoxy-manno-octulosonate cytidylyltransferase (CMP-KDO synthetase)